MSAHIEEAATNDTAGCCKCESKANTGSIYYMLRVMNGLSMAELAPLVGCQPNTISQLEHGDSAKFKVIKAMSELFGVSMDDLVRNNIAAIATAKRIMMPSTGVNRHKAKKLADVDTGDLGEAIVAEIERKLLSGTKYENCVSTKPAKNRRNGYDIISATVHGRPKFIEVKTTTSTDPDEPFHMTAAEYRKMKTLYRDGAIYRLYRIYALDTTDKTYKMIVYSAREVLDLYKPITETYLMKKRG